MLLNMFSHSEMVAKGTNTIPLFVFLSLGKSAHYLFQNFRADILSKNRFYSNRFYSTLKQNEQ